MPRSSSAEPARQSSSKRKGTRSVSTLTPSQLARKRANDREAQRAIRARTKEHIERLERELEEMRSIHSRDRTVQDLLRRNKALEDELRQLKESMGIAISSSPYSAPAVYDESAGNIPSPRLSPLPAPGSEYMHEYSQSAPQYVGVPNGIEGWAANLPASVPSPTSSVNTEEYGIAAAYIPTSAPMMNSHSGISAVEAKEAKMEYEEVHMMAEQGYMAHQSQQQRPQSWNIYPGMYYDGNNNATACLSR